MHSALDAFIPKRQTIIQFYYSYIFDFFERAGLTPATCVTLMEQCSKAISFLTTTGRSLHKNGNNIQKMLDAVKVYVHRHSQKIWWLSGLPLQLLQPPTYM